MKSVSARGIVIKDNKVLLIYRENGGRKYYSIPGGKVEPGEEINDTVVREILEETSITINIVKYLGCFGQEGDEKEHHIFRCNYISGEPKLGDSVEMELMKNDPSNYYRPEWVSFDIVPALKIIPPPVEPFLKDYIKECIAGIS